MNFALCIISYVFLALNISPGKASYRVRYDSDERLKNIWDINSDLNIYNKYRRNIQRGSDKKPILRGGFENDNNLEILRAYEVEENDVGYNDYDRHDDQWVDNYEEKKDNSRTEDRSSLEAVKNERPSNSIAALLLNNSLSKPTDLDNSLNDTSSSSSDQSEISDSIFGNNGELLHKGLLRSCYTYVVKNCRKACKKAYKSACRSEKCGRRLKRRFKSECKFFCKELA